MFDYLDLYEPTPLESFIMGLYKKYSVRRPDEIDLEMFAHEASIWIHYASLPTSHHEHDNGLYSIVVDDRIPWELQRVELAHELGHVLLHTGDQWNMPRDFRLMQEWQADRFAAYALAPTFMIANCIVQDGSRQQLVSQLAYTFDVPETFMDGRVEMLFQRLQTLAAQRHLDAVANEHRQMYDYTYRNHFNPRIEYWVKDGRIVHTRRRAEI